MDEERGKDLGQLFHEYFNVLLMILLGVLSWIFMDFRADAKAQLVVLTTRTNELGLLLQKEQAGMEQGHKDNQDQWAELKLLQTRHEALEAEMRLRTDQLTQFAQLLRDLKILIDGVAVKQIEHRESLIRIEEQIRERVRNIIPRR